MQRIGELRLSAVRAFLGRIHQSVRLIKIRTNAGRIQLTIINDGVPSELLQENISEAESEIIADFPNLEIETHVLNFQGDLPVESLISEGWIYLARDVVGDQE